MAIPAGTYKTYEAVGIREDLSDVITNISPSDTLFYSSLKERKATSTRHEWLTDTLASPATNAQLEGDDRTAQLLVAAAKLYNITQIQSKTIRISESNMAVKSAGNVTTVAYQTAKALKELAGDIEYAFLREVREDGNAGTARKMRGALNWIITNLSKAADATLNPDGTVTGGTPRPLTETLLKEVLQNVFISGGKPRVIYCGPFQKRKISEFAGAGNYRTVVEEKKLTATVDVYVGDFSVLQITPHRIMPTDVLFICDPDYWSKATLRPTKSRQLAKTGDSDIYDVTVEHTLEANAEAANGRITNLTTS